MGTSIAANAYKDALPKFKRVGVWEFVSRTAGVLGIIVVIGSYFYSPKTYNEYVYSIFSIFIIVSLLLYIWNYEKRKLHRYAQAVLFVHYVNHVARDFLECRRSNCEKNLEIKQEILDILDAISRCFSLIVGKNCRACIKELDKKQKLKTIFRDSISSGGSNGGASRARSIEHLLEDNTDFKSLWYREVGAIRYFLSNDLVELYRDGKYENSSFEEVGTPTVTCHWQGFRSVKNWNLPYKSTIVLPIRYIPDDQIGEDINGGHKEYRFWGFLCVDCNSKNVFDKIYSPELGGAFADVLYMLFSQLEEMKEKKKR